MGKVSMYTLSSLPQSDSDNCVDILQLIELFKSNEKWYSAYQDHRESKRGIEGSVTFVTATSAGDERNTPPPPLGAGGPPRAHPPRPTSALKGSTESSSGQRGGLTKSDNRSKFFISHVEVVVKEMERICIELTHILHLSNIVRAIKDSTFTGNVGEEASWKACDYKTLQGALLQNTGILTSEEYSENKALREIYKYDTSRLKEDDKKDGGDGGLVIPQCIRDVDLLLSDAARLVTLRRHISLGHWEECNSLLLEHSQEASLDVNFKTSSRVCRKELRHISRNVSNYLTTKKLEAMLEQGPIDILKQSLKKGNSVGLDILLPDMSEFQRHIHPLEVSYCLSVIMTFTPL